MCPAHRILLKSGKYRFQISKSIELNEDECHICHEMKIVLAIDTSGGEYVSRNICKRCIEKAFQDYEQNHIMGMDSHEK